MDKGGEGGRRKDRREKDRKGMETGEEGEGRGRGGKEGRMENREGRRRDQGGGGIWPPLSFLKVCAYGPVGRVELVTPWQTQIS